MHSVASISSLYIPTAHFVHVDIPSAAAIVPSSHCEHAVLAMLLVYFPVMHTLHSSAPTIALNLPDSQFVHADMPLSEDLPAAQSTHCRDNPSPEIVEYLPLVQALHDTASDLFTTN
jgi:hypothetical protein